MITKKQIAEKIKKYLYGDILTAEMVDWAEHAMMEDDFDEGGLQVIRDTVSRHGLADVRAFGLTLKE